MTNNQAVSKQLLHLVQLFGGKSDQIEATAAFCTLLVDGYGNKWDILAIKMYKVQLFVEKVVFYLTAIALGATIAAFYRFL